MSVILVKEPSLENKFTAYVNCGHHIGKLEYNWANFFYQNGLDTLKYFNHYIMKNLSRLKGNKFIRSHNVITTNSASYRGNRYNWKTIDRIYDTLMDYNLNPLVEMGSIPSNLGKDGLLKDFIGWEELVYNFIKHLVKRYGKVKVRDWYFSLWNEPDLSSGKNTLRVKEYCKMYDFTVKGAVSAYSDIRIGGPESAGDTCFIDGFLKHCAEGKNYATGKMGSRLDFFSFHIYCNSPDKKPVSSHFHDKCGEVKTLISAYPAFANIPVLLTEWGMTWGGVYTHFPTNYRNDNYAAAFTCRIVKGMIDADCNLLVFCGFSENNWKGKYETGNFNNTRSIITKDNIKRPVFGAYELLNMLGQNRVYFGRGSNSFKFDGLATVDKDSVKVLMWNFHDDPDIQESDATIALTIKNIPIEKENLNYEEYRLDSFNNNSYSAYVEFGQPLNLTKAQIKELQRMADGVTKPVKREKISLNKKSVTKEVRIPMHGVILIRIW